MKIIIKNMVCERCKIAVRNIFEQLAIDVVSIQLGEVTLVKPLSLQQKEPLKQALDNIGLALLDDAKFQTIERIKQSCLKYLNQQLFHTDLSLSKHISQQVPKEYSHLSRLFSAVEAMSIEQYYLLLRIEKVKELIIYEQLAFAEIAYDLGFSSIAHLSRQFKKHTGLTLTEFKQSHTTNTRQALDKVKNL